MSETIISNDELGITLVKTDLNGVNVVWADDVRKALKWDKISNMIRGLKEGKEVIKVRISALDQAFNELVSKLSKTYVKGGRPMTYAYFLTRQGVSRLIATRRPHDVKDDPELAEWLDRLQDWIFGDVLPEVLATGQYTGRPLEAGKHAVNGFPQSISEALRMLADEYDSHSLTIDALDDAVRTKAQVSREREGTMFSQLGVMTRKMERIQMENFAYRDKAFRYDKWIGNMSKGQQRRWHGDPKQEDKEPAQPYLFDENGNPA